MHGITRRAMLAGAAGCAFGADSAPVVETHVHLFAADQARFPFHPNASYKPQPATLESFVEFASVAGIAHAVIVHPEPYQDDHRYLLYCLEHEPSPGFFKGTCLFDPIRPDTPQRMKALKQELGDRLVALRIHATAEPSKYPTTAGPIRDRDLSSAEMRRCWAAASELGLAIQMHFTPYYAPAIYKLAAEFRATPVILDHLGRAGQGTPEQLPGLLRLGELPRTYLKFSGVAYSSKQPFPHADVEPLMRRFAQAFGAGRILWGTLGMNIPEFRKSNELFGRLLAFLPASDRAKIRGENALRLFRWSDGVR